MTRQARIVLVLFVLFAATGMYLLSIPGLAPIASAMPASLPAGQQRYVQVGGANVGDCTNLATPCGSIDYAIGQSVAGSATLSDTINLFPGKYNLASTLVITKYIILQGYSASNGADVQIDGQNSFGVIHAEAPRLTINNLTIQNGNAGPSGVGGGINVSGTSAVTIRNSFFLTNTAAHGGGIYTNDAGSLYIVRSQFGNNSATGNGGAIFGGPGASTVITASAIISNSAGDGAGIYNQGALTVVNSTLSDNGTPAVTGNGGGIFTTGTGTSVGLNNATISFNGVNGNGGGIFASGSTVTVQNSIIAMNTGPAGANCFGTIGNGGFNLDGDTSCGWGTTNGSLSSTDPLLGPLTRSGGYTMYRMPGAGSLAINAGNNVTGCTDGQGHLLTVDQRNSTRPQGGRCDIGSVEVGDAPSLTNINPSSAMAGSGGFSMTLTGANFAASNPRVLWVVNGMTTTFVTTTMTSHSTTDIVLNVPGSAIIFPGTALVAVQNPSAPAPNISGELPFTIIVNPSQKFLYLPLIRK